MKIGWLGLAVVVAALAVSGCHRKPNAKAHSNAAGAPSALNPSGAGVTSIPGRISLAAMGRRIPVIMYHDVVASLGPGSVYFDDTSAQFRAQMQFIKDNGLVPITIKQLYDHLQFGTDVPANAICLTFDDNYLGFYQNAYPILKEFGYPSAMFVHTNYVGDETGSHPKMNWTQLNQLVKEGLVTIGAHTESHPLDMTVLTDHQQTTEIAGSKEILEKHLGVPINFIAWPNGKFNTTSINIAIKSGYKMAMAMDSGFAEESPGMYQIHRFPFEKLQEAVEKQAQLVTDIPAAIDQTKWNIQPVRLHVQTTDGLLIAFVTGGKPETMMSDMREGVKDFVERAGAAAGVNGGFFAMSSLYSTSNVMIGPCYTSDRRQFTTGTESGVLDRLKNRPVIMWSDSRAAIMPFQPQTMDDEAIYRAFMPDFTNLFVAGAWLIHEGVPMTDDQMLQFDSKDLADPRRRVFFGWMKDGQPVAGASLQTCTTERLAQVAAEAGVQDAVLLDSGFSTSVVYNDKVVVTGHTAKDIPSRPVPHAIVFLGQLDLTGVDSMMKQAAIGAIDPADIVGARRGRIHRRREREVVPIGESRVRVRVKGPSDNGDEGDQTGTTGSDSGSTTTTGDDTGDTTGSTSGTGSTTGGTTGSSSTGSTSGSTGSSGGTSGSTGSSGTSTGGTGSTGPRKFHSHR